MKNSQLIDEEVVTFQFNGYSEDSQVVFGTLPGDFVEGETRTLVAQDTSYWSLGFD